MGFISYVGFYFVVAVVLLFSAPAGCTCGDLDGALNAVYMIENQAVHLVNGQTEIPSAPGSAAKSTTRVMGAPAAGDLDNDGRDDAALFLEHAPGGSGTFYYVAAAVVKKSHWQGTNAVLLGDRIIPQTVHIRNGVIIVGFADRRTGQAMAEPPSIEKIMCLTLTNNRLTLYEISPACR